MARSVAIALTLAALGCTGPEAGEFGQGTDSPANADSGADAGTFIDAAGSVHDRGERPGRIVSLVPSATATLRAIGAQDLLIGRTDFDTQPWLADVPSVGGGLGPNLEALVALRPDLVFRFEGEQDPRTPARLDELGIRHVAVRPVSLEDIYATNRIVGLAIGRVEATDSLSRVIRADLEAVVSSVATRPRLRVAFVLGGSPPWVSGPGTFVADVISLAGGNNVFEDLTQSWAAVSPEELRTRELDVVLVPGEGGYDTSLTPGARIEVIGSILDLPGPDVASAARRVAEILHGKVVR